MICMNCMTCFALWYGSALCFVLEQATASVLSKIAICIIFMYSDYYDSLFSRSRHMWQKFKYGTPLKKFALIW